MKLSQAILAALALVAGPLQAATLVDTGVPVTRTFTYSLGFQGPDGMEGVQFTTASKVTVTSLQSFFSHPSNFLTDSDVLMFGNIAENDTSGSDEVPGTVLYGESFLVTKGSSGDWFGPTGVSWVLDPGTYWATFEVENVSCPACRVSGWIDPPTSLPSAYGSNGSWVSMPESWGLRMEASVVPVPAAAWLFGSGLVGLLGMARRKRS